MAASLFPTPSTYPTHIIHQSLTDLSITHQQNHRSIKRADASVPSPLMERDHTAITPKE
jgi:hypothetical protein